MWHPWGQRPRPFGCVKAQHDINNERSTSWKYEYCTHLKAQRFIMQCLILIKKVDRYIIHKLIYCGIRECVCVRARACVDVSDTLRRSLATGDTSR